METKRILITGGTGFIGEYLCSELMKEGHMLTLITRAPEKYEEEQAKNQQFISWDSDLVSAMQETDVVINLVGENLFGQRWTDTVKKKIYDSRILTTRKLVDAVRESSSKPELFISASGVNFYGDSGDELIDENSLPGNNFLSKVCMDWEGEARKAGTLGVRVAIPRIAPVLEIDGGIIAKMKLPFAFFVGGPLGPGNQYLPWIHMDDLCRAIMYPIQNQDVSGPDNACSPEPVTMNKLAEALGNVMNRPSFFRVPEFILRIILGEASLPVLCSLRVQPKVLQLAGFEFEYKDLQQALADIL